MRDWHPALSCPSFGVCGSWKLWKWSLPSLAVGLRVSLSQKDRSEVVRVLCFYVTCNNNSVLGLLALPGWLPSHGDCTHMGRGGLTVTTIQNSTEICFFGRTYNELNPCHLDQVGSLPWPRLTPSSLCLTYSQRSLSCRIYYYIAKFFNNSKVYECIANEAHTHNTRSKEKKTQTLEIN